MERSNEAEVKAKRRKIPSQKVREMTELKEQQLKASQPRVSGIQTAPPKATKPTVTELKNTQKVKKNLTEKEKITKMEEIFNQPPEMAVSGKKPVAFISNSNE